MLSSPVRHCVGAFVGCRFSFTDITRFGIRLIARSGRSIFSRPKPIDLRAGAARRLDIDMLDDERDAYHPIAPGPTSDVEEGQNGEVLFDAGHDQRPEGGEVEDEEDHWG